MITARPRTKRRAARRPSSTANGNSSASAGMIGSYLESRLQQIGLKRHFAVDSGFAAQGYARPHGAAARVITFSVGALSAFNALASTYAERRSVILISGNPNITDLADAGARRIYGVSGDSLNGITDSIRARGVRHEEATAFVAGAEAHLTGTWAV